VSVDPSAVAVAATHLIDILAEINLLRFYTTCSPVSVGIWRSRNTVLSAGNDDVRVGQQTTWAVGIRRDAVEGASGVSRQMAGSRRPIWR
jgi:hypothetical protein